LPLTLPRKGEPGCYAWLSGVVMSVGFGWPVTVTDRPGPLVRSRCGTDVAWTRYVGHRGMTMLSHADERLGRTKGSPAEIRLSWMVGAASLVP